MSSREVPAPRSNGFHRIGESGQRRPSEQLCGSFSSGIMFRGMPGAHSAGDTPISQALGKGLGMLAIGCSEPLWVDLCAAAGGHVPHLCHSKVGEDLWHITVMGETAPGREWLLEKSAPDLLAELDEESKTPVLEYKPLARFADAEAEKRFKRTITNAQKRPEQRRPIRRPRAK